MRIDQYPPQEPMSENMQAYHDHLMRQADESRAHEAQYGDDPYQSIMVFPAEKPNGTVLMYLHGGGWTNGYKEWMAFMAPALNALGITYATAGYRLAPRHVFPAGLQDCGEALKWLAANVKQFGGDPDMMFVGGHSAGGHYAALLATADSLPDGTDVRPLIRGSAPVSGSFYFGEESGMAVRPRFLGAPESGNEVHASPLRRLSGPTCPFLLTWGEKDFPHLIVQAQQMSDALQRQGTRVDTLVLPRHNHFTASHAAGEVDGLWPDRLSKWMQSIVN
ncbi:alpha/beta hydrolase [Pusillimonas noertemannii]|uniref:Acetyl esterase/lipase n=1 Tax=Pusillimonas noertemannii TaxID=305977 RepID=A0A2U1CNL7_9BURK|nr:alpha/beta hydrolase [Pusillimonas noertemannii]NYT68382.1 alpha/beta hydrolase [Pusillimonas noertemannii]PVY62602.1 acetyl esterase/lipase [Pusillimonas noertemannii]TFL10452.1 alpha/beta hydrolase [Pusillimonas noertemannii]